MIQVDGVRAPSLFTFGVGPFNTSTRNMVDLDSMKKVEILRGPASTLYGSDALGGVVSYITKDPLDYLNLAASPVYGAVKSALHERQRRLAEHGDAAAGTKDMQGMLMYTYYTGQRDREFRHQRIVGPARTAPNPLDIEENNWLAKLVFTPNPDNTLKFTYERTRTDTDIDILSLNASTPRTSALYRSGSRPAAARGTSITTSSIRAARGSRLLGLAVPAEVHDRLGLAGDARGDVGGLLRRGQRRQHLLHPAQFDFQQTVTGGTAQVESLRRRGARRSASCGAARCTRRRHPRFATPRSTTSRRARSATRSPATRFRCATFPTRRRCRSAPTCRTRSRCSSDRLIVTPALRFDYYRLTISPDSIYNNNTPPGGQPSDFSDSAWSPKLAAMYNLDQNWNVYGNYAFGFRAPPFDDVNAAFRNPVQSYVLIPNPDLKSETSQGIEIGLKGDGAEGTYRGGGVLQPLQATSSTRAWRSIAPPIRCACPASRSRSSRSTGRASRSTARKPRASTCITPNWSVAGSIAYAHGEDTTLDQPLNSIGPLTGVVGVRYASTLARLGPVRRRAQRDRGPEKIDVADAAIGTVHAVPHARIRDGRPDRLLDDQRSTRSSPPACSTSSTRSTGCGATSTRGACRGIGAGLDRYTQPGINASVSIQLAFP